MIGNIRAGNLRTLAPKSVKPKLGETIIRFDRANPILGNRHILHNPNDPIERAKVIAAYKEDLDYDLSIKGPMYIEIVKLAIRVKNGENIIGLCWCKPKPCHADLIIKAVMDKVNSENT